MADNSRRRFFASKKVRTLRWFCLKALWPSSVISASYLLYRYIVDSHEPFAAAFGHGDFLLFSLLLLIETAIDSEHLDHENFWLEVARLGSLWIALLCTLAYAVSKVDIATLLPKAEVVVQHRRMLAWAWVNCTSAVIAIGLSMIAVYAISAIEEEADLAKALDNGLEPV